ncbi:MAG: hypothetical protein KatS3mg100_540 [Candidatus Parcubacteria bacterium]|nr:MAG: hypothetical protein KatS3mg100_540 [Candidatus Parcubacteria bacterium]
MAIFGYKYGKWEFIGAIANEFDSDSIANEFGAGNEFSSDSIFNEFGSFGSEFSSYSAFNEFASNPPIIVNDDYKFVGYLTINDFKTPNINTYEAIACAKNSFRSFLNSDLKDTVFKNIPSGGYSGSSGYSQQELENLLKSICPANSTYINGQCTCNEGFTANGSVCVTYTQNCQLKYGPNSYGDKQYCYCSPGYEFNSDKTACIQSVVCPVNATRLGGSCVCNEGFVLRNGQCITHTADCRLSFGDHVVGSKGNAGNSFCNCEAGYIWNATQTGCIKFEVQPTIVPIQPIERKTEVVPPPLKTEQKLQSAKKEVIKEKPEEDLVKAASTTSLFMDSEAKVKKTEKGFFAKVFSSIKNFFSRIFR